MSTNQTTPSPLTPPTNDDKMQFKEKYTFEDNRCLIEQYKVYLQMLEGSNKRRMDTNTFFITINALMATVASLFNKGNTQALILVCVTGFLFSVLWGVMLVNYNVVNKAKWAVVNEMEAHLQCNPFDSEYPKMKKQKYLSISVLERWLPVVFVVIYGCIGYYAWKHGGSANADLSNAVNALQEAVSELTADLAGIALAGIGG